MGRPITPQDLWAMQRVGQPEHVPGTTSVVVPVVAYLDDGRPHSTIWQIDRAGNTTRLTSQDRSSSAPTPSHDGSRIAFLGAQGDDPSQVFVMSLHGGEATKVTDLPLGASSVTWVPGDDSLIVTGPLFRDHPEPEATEAERDARKETTPPVVTEDRIYRHWKKWLAGARIDHLFRVDLTEGSTNHLTPGLDRLIGLEDVGDSITVTPDGRWVIFTLDDDPEPWEHLRFALHRIPVAGGDIERLVTGEAAAQYRPRVSPDGSTLV